MRRTLKSWWLVAKAIATLILIGLLVAGGFAVYHLGRSNGYAAGLLAAEGEGVVAQPYGWPHGPGYYTRPALFGGVLALVLILVLIAVVGKLISFVIWRPPWRFAMAGPWHRHWRHAQRRYMRWHRMHGPMPPWCWDWDEPSDEETEEAGDEPDAEG